VKLGANHAEAVRLQPNQILVGPSLPRPLSQATSVSLRAEKAGLFVVRIDGNRTHQLNSEQCLQVSVFHSTSLNAVSDVVGWAYLVAWSVSFYPQIALNFRRKSVRGLNLDFVWLNTLGFLCYASYNCALYWSSVLRGEYIQRFPFGIVPVMSNDVAFSIHALAACMLTLIQTFLYERVGQRVSRHALGMMVGCLLLISFFGVLATTQTILLLDLLDVLSYVKLAVTLVKYVPQAWFNFRRKSTSGWSIHNVLLDTLGGTLSVAQMSILAYNYDDWESMVGDVTKLGLGVFSILFDLLFIIQHYVLYGDATEYAPFPEEESTENNREGESEANVE